eukprot:TRINITY_DN63011_c0_g1_i1.p1 TRINITY_DN63011_c0_g1~~TRINITY_DN63011_c0_g1_i1.p1  ORF type:complete len:367 (-),score=61.93 TRINITY_DN63011_c0_g1_i1:62-1162(-)
MLRQRLMQHLGSVVENDVDEDDDEGEDDRMLSLRRVISAPLSHMNAQRSNISIPVPPVAGRPSSRRIHTKPRKGRLAALSEGDDVASSIDTKSTGAIQDVGFKSVGLSSMGSRPSSAGAKALEGQRDEERRNLQADTLAARRRLQLVTDVNKMLHASIVNKRVQIEKAKSELEKLEGRLRNVVGVLGPGRAMCVENLSNEVRSAQQLQQVSNLELANEIMEWEESVADLTLRGLQLREMGQTNRATMKDQQQEIVDKRKQNRDLRRHLEILEGDEFAQSRAMPMPGEERVFDGSQGFTGGRCPTMSEDLSDEGCLGDDSTFADGPLGQMRSGLLKSKISRSGASRYENLPGLDLEGLLGGFKDTAS